MAKDSGDGVFFFVRQAWRLARKRNLVGCGGQSNDFLISHKVQQFPLPQEK
jgi:hypothetical protein